jgi:hypothetical protein
MIAMKRPLLLAAGLLLSACNADWLCPQGERMCGNSCVAVTSPTDHCGGCGPNCLKCQAGTCVKTLQFNYTGGIDAFQVPAGVTALTMDVYCAQGEPGQGTDGVNGGPGGGAGGRGGRAMATRAVAFGDTIYLLVGSMSGDVAGDLVTGAPGGLTAGGHGGAWSEVRFNTSLASGRIILAGGGGGGGGPAGAGIVVGAAGVGCASWLGQAGVGNTGGAGRLSTSAAGTCKQPGGGGGGGGGSWGSGGGGGSAGTTGCTGLQWSGAGGGGGGGLNRFTAAAPLTGMLEATGVNTGEGKIILSVP